MSTKSPAFQFYAAEYLADENVQVMTLQQEGIYVRALSFCWREGSIPNEPARFRALVGKPENAISDEDVRVVQRCFNQHPTDAARMVHPRLEKEREKQQNWRQKSSQGGQKSAEKRRKKPDFKGGSTVVQPKGNSSSSSSSSSSIPPTPQNPGEGTPDRASFAFVKVFFKMNPVNIRGELELKDAVEAFAKLGAGETEIRRRGKLYRDKYPGMDFSPNALLRNWNKLEPAPAPAAARNPSAQDVAKALGI